MREDLPQPLAVVPQPSSGGELNARILRPLVRYVAECHGDHALMDICQRVGLDRSKIDGGSHWLSLEDFEGVLAGARALVDSDDAFKSACVYEYAREGFGTLRMVLWALSPRAVYETGAKNFRMISTISRVRYEWHSDQSFTCRYYTERTESRLMCLSRQAQTAEAPMLWGLPPARLVEMKCVATGDDCCEYQCQIHAHRRWRPIVYGAAAGVALGIAGAGLGLSPLVFGLAAIGGLIGHARELRRTNAVNANIVLEMRRAFEEVAHEEAEARKEILALHLRQRQWSAMLEETVADRTRAMEKVIDKLRRLDETRQTTIRGVSHDIRNPLTFLDLETEFLREELGTSPSAESLIEGHATAVSRIRGLITDLIEIAVSEGGRLPLNAEVMGVAPLTDSLRKRLSALVYGRDVKVSVFANREVPRTITIDPRVFDRVVDNLLTNAAKYTERGSIIVELDGTPGFLTLKVSDTGRGIPEAKIRDVFEPKIEQAKADPSSASFGLGLSVVVGLLDQVGGKLAVMSRPGEGTTFWAHFPVEMKAPEAARAGDPINRVVTIRKVENA